MNELQIYALGQRSSREGSQAAVWGPWPLAPELHSTNMASSGNRAHSRQPSRHAAVISPISIMSSNMGSTGWTMYGDDVPAAYTPLERVSRSTSVIFPRSHFIPPLGFDKLRLNG
jgi:hypothetical protein